MENVGSRKKGVLCVEDEVVICDLYRRVLSSEGFEVDIATDGEIAQEMIDKKQYNLYLIDIRIPKLNGKELYWWLQEKHPSQINKVVFATGSVIGESTLKFIEQANRPCLKKPFTSDELKAFIKKQL